MEQGRRGPTGDTGRVGDTGRTGDTGAEGGAGTPGAAGAKGQEGKEGPRNSRGLLWLIAVGGALLLLMTVVLSTITLLQAKDVKRNTARIDDIRNASGDVIVARCQSENILRGELSELVVSGRDNLRQYRKRGLLTEREFQETVRDQNDALRKLSKIDCRKTRERYLRTSD